VFSVKCLVMNGNLLTIKTNFTFKVCKVTAQCKGAFSKGQKNEIIPLE